MMPMSPKRLADRVSQRLSVSIPHVGRRINESTSAPGTAAEFYKAGEMRYYLELPTGLGEFQLDSALEAQEQDEDDILMWLDSLKVEEPAEAAPEKSDHSAPEQRPAEVLRPENAHPQGTPQLVIDAISPVGKEKAQSDNAKGSRPNSPSFIPRKPVPSGVPNNNLLSPPVPQQAGGMPSPPTPSDYSGAFQGRISFASSVGDAFKYDSYAEEVERLSWRSSSAASDLSEHVTVAGLRLHGIPASAAVTSSVTSSSGSSPQTNPGSTFSSPNPSDYSTTPSSGSLCRSDIDAILGAAPMKKSEPRFNVYIDDDASTGMLSSEIEAILLAQMRREEEESKQTQAERQRDDELDKEYIKRMEARRTRYVRGRNSQFEEDILFILKSEDIIF
ncbi:hypothetical protein BDZ91DRAFT_537142 [Kalaharituber pfeilii]|nr:hypothetical protein BDZ91DRAFT_537142 [Kalaharituber pfeilii]